MMFDRVLRLVIPRVVASDEFSDFLHGMVERLIAAINESENPYDDFLLPFLTVWRQFNVDD